MWRCIQAGDYDTSAFEESGRYDYAETGSLVSIKENVEDTLIPSE